MKTFRQWNQGKTDAAVLALCGPEEMPAYRGRPYAWMILLIPMAGIVAFVSIGWEWSIAKRRKELDASKRFCGECGAVHRDENDCPSCHVRSFHPWPTSAGKTSE